MKNQNTQTRLKNLIQADVAAGGKIKWLEVNDADRASLIEEIRKESGPLAKAMKKSGIDVALPSLNGVPLKWQAMKTQTVRKQAAGSVAETAPVAVDAGVPSGLPQ